MFPPCQQLQMALKDTNFGQNHFERKSHLHISGTFKSQQVLDSCYQFLVPLYYPGLSMAATPYKSATRPHLDLTALANTENYGSMAYY